MPKRCLAIAALAACSTGAHAAGLDISLSDTTAHIQYLTDSGSLGYGGADVGFGVFFNESDDVIGTANLLVTSNPASGNNLQFGVGAKAYGGDIDAIDEDVTAIAIGGLVRYVIPSQTPMGIAIEAYGAPKVTSFDDTRNLVEIMTRFEIEVMPSTRGYIGYRFLEPELERAGEVELDDEVHLGIRIVF
jgi:hypothetical protein